MHPTPPTAPRRSGAPPVVLCEGLDCGPHPFPGDVGGSQAEAQPPGLRPHHVVKLVPKQRDGQHGDAVVHRLQEAVLTAMGDEEARFRVTWGEAKDFSFRSCHIVYSTLQIRFFSLVLESNLE